MPRAGGRTGEGGSQPPLIHHGQWPAWSAVLLWFTLSLLGCDFSRSHEWRTSVETAAPVPPPHLWCYCRSGSRSIAGRAPGLRVVEVGGLGARTPPGAQQEACRGACASHPSHPPSRPSPHTFPGGPCALTLSPHGPPSVTPARRTRASGPCSRPAAERPPEKDRRLWCLTQSLAGPAFRAAR